MKKHNRYFVSLLALLFFLCFGTHPALADESGEAAAEAEEESPWQFSGLMSQQINQVSFSHWAQGGENSFASTSLINLNANYKKRNFSWENRLNLAYGILKIEDTPTRKNEDRIHFLSKGGREVSPKFSTSFLAEFRTQFAKGYNYPNDSVVVSNFMAPGNLTLSIGMEYKPFEYLSIFLSPASGKFTFVLDDDINKAAFGVEEDKNVNAEFGALLNIMFNKEIFEDVLVESKLTLFNNLVDEDKSNRKNTDVDWETSINIKINRYITASALVHMLYDHDTLIPVDGDPGTNGKEVTRKLQIKQLFGLGLSYRF